MNNRKLTPINRNNLFYSEEDFLMETDIVEGYIEEDLNQSVILYQVDRKRTQINNTYKESKSNVFIIVIFVLLALFIIFLPQLSSFIK